MNTGFLPNCSRLPLLILCLQSDLFLNWSHFPRTRRVRLFRFFLLEQITASKKVSPCCLSVNTAFNLWESIKSFSFPQFEILQISEWLVLTSHHSVLKENNLVFIVLIPQLSWALSPEMANANMLTRNSFIWEYRLFATKAELCTTHTVPNDQWVLTIPQFPLSLDKEAE